VTKGVVGLKSLSPYLSLGTTGQNIEINQIPSGFTSIGSGSNVLTGGAVVLASGNSNLTIATDPLANTITFTTAGASGGVSSLSGGTSGLTGAVVLAGSGNTTVSQSGQTITVSSTGGGSSVIATPTPLPSGYGGEEDRVPPDAWAIFYTNTCGYFNTGLSAPIGTSTDFGIFNKNPCIGLFNVSNGSGGTLLSVGTKYIVKLEIGWNWPGVGGSSPPPVDSNVYYTGIALWGNSGSNGVQTPANDWNFQAYGVRNLTGWTTIGPNVNQPIAAPSGNANAWPTALYEIPFTYAGNDVPNYLWITAYAWSTVKSFLLPAPLPPLESNPECFAWLIDGSISPA
jgi:hypothetical protein